MRWRKLGRIYCAEGSAGWARSHAFLPTPVLLADRIRVYVAFLDDEKVGRVGYVEVASDDPRRVLRVSKTPVLEVGPSGSFDDNGVTPMCVVPNGDELWLYYTGWQLGTRVRYFLFTGLAVSRDGGETFERRLDVPVLDRGPGEWTTRTAVFVRREGQAWKGWYVGGAGWIDDEGVERPTYDLRYVESDDGLTWPRTGGVVLSPQGDEFGLGRPWIVGDGTGAYRMWYSRRRRRCGYRLGYAESADGISWTRKDDQVGLDVSEDGWDSEMACFASVLEAGGETYLFYNGNNYGETGFGAAVLEEP